MVALSHHFYLPTESILFFLHFFLFPFILSAEKTKTIFKNKTLHSSSFRSELIFFGLQSFRLDEER